MTTFDGSAVDIEQRPAHVVQGGRQGLVNQFAVLRNRDSGRIAAGGRIQDRLMGFRGVRQCRNGAQAAQAQSKTAVLQVRARNRQVVVPDG